MPPDKTIKSSPPTTEMDYYQQGWLLHSSRKDEDAAEEKFRQALDSNPKHLDAYFGLGLVLKSQDRKQESIQAFQKVLELLESDPIDDKSRSEMLRRLTLAHINRMKSGDWNLEKEIWKHSR
jgi:tetratricopeptide (TPR) repeat protein